MINRIVCILLVSCGLLSCSSGSNLYPLEDYRFVDIFGQRRDDTTNGIYSLQCSGWRSAKYQTDNMVMKWTGDHPNANVQQVCSFTSTDPATSVALTNTYCWLISDKDTINTYLVRNGCCYAATMLWQDGFNKMLTPGYDSHQHTETKVNITERSYKTFLEQLKLAEAYAQANKLGIWALPDSLR
jgi:hypothetical protein